MGEPDELLDSMPGSVRLAIDFGTELQLEIDGVSPRLQSKVVGMEQDRFLIVKTPSASEIGGISVKLFPGNRVIARYVFSGSVYGFETSIIESVTSPFSLLFLNFPRVINERNIRSNRRIHTALPARIEAGDNSKDGTITDISITGCQFEARIGKPESAAFDKVDAEVQLALQLPGMAGELQIAGVLRNVRKDGGSLKLGMSFADLDESAQLQIDSYVKLSD